MVQRWLTVLVGRISIRPCGPDDVPPAYQHKVLFWGIVGAILLRVVFIVGGLALMDRFHWTIYLFGTFLLATGVMMMLRKESVYDPEKNWIIRTSRRVFLVTDRYENDRLAIPHARLDGIDKPVLIFARADEGVPLESTNERAELVFLLLTPSRMPRIQVRLLADIAGLFGSEYVTERLRKAQMPEEVIEVIRAGQQVAVDSHVHDNPDGRPVSGGQKDEPVGTLNRVR